MPCFQVQQANSCPMEEWLHATGGHNKVEYYSGSHLKRNGFRSIALSLALAFSLRRGPRRIVARLQGVLEASPPKNSTVDSCGWPALL